MKAVVESLKDDFDYESNYYFYHETSDGRAKQICDEGLYFKGENELLFNNLLYSTATPFTSDLTDNEIEFAEFLSGEKRTLNNARRVNEIVIIGVPKANMDFAIDSIFFNLHPEIDAHYMLHYSFILGYVDLEREELVRNEKYFDYNEPLIYLKKHF